MKIEIKNRFNGSVLFTHEAEGNTLKITLEMAIKAGADLRSADLRSANLRSANLSGADLSGAYLSGANLSSANLSGANLSGADLSDADLRSADLRSADLRYADLSDANLRYANLSSANLSDANLSGANLSSANLSGANLSGANLSGADLRSANLSSANLRSANLSGADLSSADLTVIRDDIWAILSTAPSEVQFIIKSLRDGKVDGSAYEGECACLVGTIAKARNCSFRSIESLNPNSSRPAERFFTGIKEGDTPETNQFSKLALEWCQEWLNRMQLAFGKS